MASSPTVWIADAPGGCDIDLKVTPRASRNEIVGEKAGRLGVRVTAAPESGNANAAVVKLIAKTLKIGKTSVTVISGEVSRQKRLHIEGRTATEVRDALSG